MSCSKASLIKLCVVFLLNISWFTTGTAPPLSIIQLKREQSPTIPTTIGAPPPPPQMSPLSPQFRTATLTTTTTPERSTGVTLSSTTIGSYSDGNWAPTPPRGLSPTASSSHVQVTHSDQSLESGTTFSSMKNPSSSSPSSFKTSQRKSLKGDESESKSESSPTSSLSKKFQELFSPRIITSSDATPSLSQLKMMSYNKISHQEISDIIGASTTNLKNGESGERDSSLVSTSPNPSFSTSYLSSSSSVPEGGDELSPPVTYSRSSSNFATDENEQLQRAHQESLTPSTTPEMILSTTSTHKDFLPKISTSFHEKDSKTTLPQPPPPRPTFQTGSHIITTTTTSEPGPQEEQMEFADDYYDPSQSPIVEGDGTLSLGILFDREYSPEEIAQYIFLTGDESGVASTINDLINDGLMLSRDETIKLLEDIKTHLTELRIRYQEFLMESGMEDDDDNDTNGAEGKGDESSSESGGDTEAILEIPRNSEMNGNSSENIFE